VIDLNRLKELYNFDVILTSEHIQPLVELAKPKTFEPGDLLVEKGDTSKEIYFILSGLTRIYRITPKGEEKTMLISKELDFITNFYSVFLNQPCPFYLEALEPTSTLCMDYDKFDKILEKNPKLESKRKFVYTYLLNDFIQRLNSFILLTPEERYLEFIKKNPNITNRVHDKYIASILGITSVSLSRIRKRISERKNEKNGDN